MIAGFDIESIPNPDMLDKLPPIEVKYGNTKDPAKRAIKDEEAKAAQIEKMGLDPMLARVLSASFVSGDDQRETRIIAEMTDDAERELLQWIMGYFGISDMRFSTWNGNDFDFPFVYKRCLILGVNPANFDAPPLTAFTKRYNNERHLDLMKIFTGGQPQKFAKLDVVAAQVLGQHKEEIDFKEFPELIKTEEGRDKIKSYNEVDSMLTDALCTRMCGVLFV